MPPAGRGPRRLRSFGPRRLARKREGVVRDVVNESTAAAPLVDLILEVERSVARLGSVRGCVPLNRGTRAL